MAGATTKRKSKHLKKEAFLRAFARIGTITHAAEAAKVNPCMHYWWLNNDPAYPERFKTAEESATDSLEKEARKRAFKGSDTLLIFLMKGARPHKYRDRFELPAGAGAKITNNVQINIKGLPEKEVKGFLEQAQKLLSPPQEAAPEAGGADSTSA